MFRPLVACLLVCSLVVTPGVPAAAVASPSESPGIVGVYSDPIRDGDVGEFVVVDVPDGNYTLTDGEDRVALPDVSGRVVFTEHPELVRPLVDERVVDVERLPDLANGGERLTLLQAGERVHTVEYETATEGAVYRRDGETWTWRPLGATSFTIHRSGPTEATAFVLPDSPDVVRETLATADRRILLAGYTFTSDRVATQLIRAHDRGVEVRILLEGEPVGGLPRQQRRVLGRLIRDGIEVRVVTGPRARTTYHHPKYAVVDDRALVLTENWKPAGVGGRSSRGWGAVVHDQSTADQLARVFEADAGWHDSVLWAEFRQNASFEDVLAANATFATRHQPERVRVERAELLVAPDNAEARLRTLLRDAESSVRVVQVSVGDGPFTRALVRAARRDVEVRLLLSGAWYVREENRALADRLNERAEREGIPLTVQLADPTNYEKVHAKGLVIDGETAIVGSLNLNAQAARENREVLVVLHGQEVAGFYARVFDDDWGGEKLPLSPVLVGLVGVAVLGAVVLARRIQFEKRTTGDPSDERISPRAGASSGAPRRSRPRSSSRRGRR